MDGQLGFLGCPLAPSATLSLRLLPTSHHRVTVGVPYAGGEGTQASESPSFPLGAWGMLSPQNPCGGGGQQRWGPPPSPRAGTLQPGMGAPTTGPFPWARAGSGCFSLGTRSRPPACPKPPRTRGQGWGAQQGEPGRVPAAVGPGARSPLGTTCGRGAGGMSPAPQPQPPRCHPVGPARLWVSPDVVRWPLTLIPNTLCREALALPCYP